MSPAVNLADLLPSAPTREVDLFTEAEVKADGASDVFSGFDGVGSVTLNVNVTRVSGSEEPTLAVVAEGSDDGTDWSTMGTVGTFTGPGSKSVTVARPKDQLRFSYDITGTAAAFYVEAGFVATGEVFRGASTFQKSVMLDSADLLALKTTAVELVPAPGAGRGLLALTAAASYLPGETAYTIPTPAALEITGARDAMLSLDCAGLIDDDAGTFGIFSEAASLAPSATADWDNQPLIVRFAAATDPTDGDGSLRVTVTYAIANVT